MANAAFKQFVQCLDSEGLRDMKDIGDARMWIRKAMAWLPAGDRRAARDAPSEALAGDAAGLNEMWLDAKPHCYIGGAEGLRKFLALSRDELDRSLAEAK